MKKYIGTLIKFTNKNISEKDIKNFRKLIIKLGVKFEPMYLGNFKGQSTDIIIIDEAI